jgi:hypothetical protein
MWSRAGPRGHSTAKITSQHGLIYGELLPEGAEDDGQDRGVIFMPVPTSEVCKTLKVSAPPDPLRTARP